MKFFRLVHLAPEGGRPASNLWFLDRHAAKQYQKILLWPWEPLGFFRLPGGSEEIPLGLLKLKVEGALLPASHDPELDWICWMQHDVFGYSPVVPGRCFDPEDWRTISEHDLRDPILAPQVAEAKRGLEDALKNKNPEDESSGLD